ncbi:MAG: DsbA family oxidoreductase [Pseudomonadota bacterium]
MTLDIHITSDFICPWCYVGEARLQRAITELGLDDQVNLIWHPFELNPDMPPEGMDRKVYRSLKFGSWSRSQAMDRQTVAAAANDGLDFDYGRIERTPNTFQAHRLSAFAASHGLQTKAVTATLTAYFRDGRDIGDRTVLVEIGRETGLPGDALDAFLQSDDGAADLRRTIDAASVRSVPTFVIGDTVVGGAQPVETFVRILADAVKHAA